MDKYTKEELEQALELITLTISKCEKMQPKFKEGTSQHTLLKNRIKALEISKYLMAGNNTAGRYTREELMEALSPISSIISKCEKGQQKFAEGTSHHTRFNKMIKAMYISKSFITNEICKLE